MDNTNKESDGGNCREHLSKEENWAQSLRSLKKGIEAEQCGKGKRESNGHYPMDKRGCNVQWPPMKLETMEDARGEVRACVDAQK